MEVLDCQSQPKFAVSNLSFPFPFSDSITLSFMLCFFFSMHLFGYFQQFQIKCSQWQAILHPSLSGSLEYFPFVGLLKCQPLYPILPCNRIRKRSRTIQYSSATPQKNDCLINRCEDLARPIKIFLCIFALRILEKLSSFWIILVQRIEYGGLVMSYFLLMRKKKAYLKQKCMKLICKEKHR